MVLDPNQIPRIDPPAARLAPEKTFGLGDATPLDAFGEHVPRGLGSAIGMITVLGVTVLKVIGGLPGHRTRSSKR